MNTAWQPSIPHYAPPPTGLADPIYGSPPDSTSNLSWNERRKMKRYEKQLHKDTAKRMKDAEREQRREEQVLARQWKEYYKYQEKEARKWRKATAHHPELNYPSTPVVPAHEAHHHSVHLHSPHVAHQTATRPLPLPFVTNTGAYTAQYLPVDGALGGGQGTPMLPSLAAFGVVDTPVRGDGSVMSRTMTHASVTP